MTSSTSVSETDEVADHRAQPRAELGALVVDLEAVDVFPDLEKAGLDQIIRIRVLDPHLVDHHVDEITVIAGELRPSGLVAPVTSTMEKGVSGLIRAHRAWSILIATRDIPRGGNHKSNILHLGQRVSARALWFEASGQGSHRISSERLQSD